LAIFHIAKVTFSEALRHPLGLMMGLILSTIILFSPAFTSFNLGQGVELLRSNLLSTFMMGGIIFSSISSTNLIQREIQQKTILSLLTRPVSIPQFYFGKLLGTFAILFLFCFVLAHVCWFSLVMGTPDTASTKLNYIPTALLFISLLGIVTMAVLFNYTLNSHIISFIYKGWAIASPIIVIMALIISPIMELPIPDFYQTLEFLKATSLTFMLVLVIASFSIAIGTFTTPLVNLASSLVFLMVGLMAPGLSHFLDQQGAVLQYLALAIPNFHSFWMAEMITLGHTIPIGMMISVTSYGLCLIAAFSFVGTYTLMRRDFS
jgi:ABC-type Na+ efflux pump permease subunit